MQRLGVSGAVRPIYGSLGVKRLKWLLVFWNICATLASTVKSYAGVNKLLGSWLYRFLTRTLYM